MKPVIGITTSYDYASKRIYLNQSYCRGVEAVGGLPVVLPGVLKTPVDEQLIALLDGLILSGGVDVDPLRFDEEPVQNMGEITPERDVMEVDLTQKVLARDLPVLGICRGIQVLSAAAGGTVCQDIPSQWEQSIKHHQQAPGWYGTHHIFIEPATKLQALLGDKYAVNSFHHQAVGRVPEGFMVAARAADGVIEGVESLQHTFVLGVQFHPELMWEQDQRFLGLFQSLVRAAGAYQSKKECNM